MNREIKFRVRIEEKPDLYGMKPDGSQYESDRNWMYFCKLDEFDSINGSKNIMQYTGLKDKNGVEIYEGDILELLYDQWYGNKGKKSEVKIEDYCIEPFGEGDYLTESYQYKIIGNIHQNPNLLNDE